MSELLNGLDRVYKELQSLQLEPTKRNVTILSDAMQVLEKAFAFIRENVPEEEPTEEEAAEEEPTEEGETDGVEC